MTEATLSAKNQIVIPREAREALGLKPGDKILVVVRGGQVLVLQKPKSYHAAIRGLARGKYPRLSPASPVDRSGHEYLHLSLRSQPKVSRIHRPYFFLA